MQTNTKVGIRNNVVNLQPVFNEDNTEMRQNTAAALLLAIALAMPSRGGADDQVVPLKYGNMDQWVVRHIKESGIIGGNTKTLYEIGPNKTINGNIPYTNAGGSPWGTSNVMAKVMGVVKTNNSVFRERRGNGYCAKMTTHLESVKVLGLMNIKVLAAGSIFLGDMKEPITGTKEAQKWLNFGIPFTGRPKAVRYDYRVSVPGTKNRVRQNGFSRKQTVAGPDYATAILLLQKRTEDAKARGHNGGEVRQVDQRVGKQRHVHHNVWRHKAQPAIQRLDHGTEAGRLRAQQPRGKRAHQGDGMGRRRRKAHPHGAAILVEPRWSIRGNHREHSLDRQRGARLLKETTNLAT